MDENLFRLFSRYLSLIPDVVDELDGNETASVEQVLRGILEFIQGQQAIQSSLQPRIPQGADLLWHLAGRNPQAFVSYLRTYPGQGFQELVTNPNQLQGVIEQLEQQFPSNLKQQEASGGQLYPSSNVEAMRYDPQSGNLFVKFHGENQQPVYQYEGVPPQIFELLRHGNAFAKTKGKNKWGEWWPMKNPSIGAALNQFIKAGGFPYQRVA